MAVETGKYMGVQAGETVPTDELRAQLGANGYTTSETDRLLADAGVDGADSVTVPEQGDLFGELWTVEPDTERWELGDGNLDASSVPDDMASRLESFREWCDEKADEDRPQHAYSKWRADKWYARAHSVGRFFAQVREQRYTTVLISLSLEQQAGESVAEHAGRFFPRTFNRRLREQLRGLGVYDRADDDVGYAGLKVRSPRLPSGDSPNEQTACGVTHVHLFLWIEGDAREADWDRLRDAHCQLDGAHDGNNPADKAVSVQVNEPPTVSPTGLPTEVGNNLPCIRADTDARGVIRPYTLWCSELRHGTNESLDTRGLSVVTTMGAFDAVGDRMYNQRESDDTTGAVGN
jgi:hypothetical protein